MVNFTNIYLGEKLKHTRYDKQNIYKYCDNILENKNNYKV